MPFRLSPTGVGNSVRACRRSHNTYREEAYPPSKRSNGLLYVQILRHFSQCMHFFDFICSTASVHMRLSTMLGCRKRCRLGASASGSTATSGAHHTRTRDAVTMVLPAHPLPLAIAIFMCLPLLYWRHRQKNVRLSQKAPPHRTRQYPPHSVISKGRTGNSYPAHNHSLQHLCVHS